MNKEPRIRLEIQGDLLKCFDQEGKPLWETPISKLVLIAEYTTNEGPWIDDYYLHFWSNEDGQLVRFAVTFYANGRDEVIQKLAECFGTAIELGLSSSTEWNSRVIWPRDLADHVYFNFQNPEPTSWFQRIKRACVGATQEFFLSDEVRGFLSQFTPEAQAY